MKWFKGNTKIKMHYDQKSFDERSYWAIMTLILILLCKWSLDEYEVVKKRKSSEKIK